MKNIFSVKQLRSAILFLWTGSFIIIIITLGIIAFKIRGSNSPIALHYNVLVGVDEFGPGVHLYKLPFIGVLIYLVNFVAFKKLRTDEFLRFLLPLVTFTCSLILLLALLFLFRVN